VTQLLPEVQKFQCGKPNKNQEKSSMVYSNWYIYAPNAFFAILHILLQTQIYCSKANPTTGNIHRSQKLFLLVFQYIFIILKMFQIRTVYINKTYLLYNVSFFNVEPF
jgi:hypothetical protein